MHLTKLARVKLRERVYSLLGRMSKSEVVKHLVRENIPRRTVYDIINRKENGLPAEDMPRKGRPPKMNQTKLAELQKSAQNKVGVSQRKLAKKFSVSKTCIQENLTKLNLKYRKRKTAPQYSDKQLEEIPKKCRKLRREITDQKTFIILDDEKYFSFGGDNMPGNAGFYTNDQDETPNNVKFKATSKFPKKILVWLALSSKGISQPFIGKCGGPAISKDVYISKCLSKLIAFIDKYHKDEKIVFWPDLASSHYAKDTIEWLTAKNIPFVPKESNPPNIPKARPIEDFWSILANSVYDKGWEAKTEAQLVRRIKKKIKEIDLGVVQTMMKGIRSKLRRMEDKGPFAIL